MNRRHPVEYPAFCANGIVLPLEVHLKNQSRMNIKNIVLATLSAVFAVGSAIGSTFLSQPVYMKAKVQFDPNAQFVCADTEVRCSDTGFNPCIVEIVTWQQGRIYLNSNGQYLPYKAGCVFVLFNDEDGTISKGRTVFEVQPY
jgi:hypothetical protein